MVHDAIVEDRFWITTHPEFLEAVAERADDIVVGAKPTARPVRRVTPNRQRTGSSVAPHASEASCPPHRRCLRLRPRRVRWRRQRQRHAPWATSGSSGSDAPAASPTPGLRRQLGRHHRGARLLGLGWRQVLLAGEGLREHARQRATSVRAPIRPAEGRLRERRGRARASSSKRSRRDQGRRRRPCRLRLTSLIDVFESANYDFTKLAQDPTASRSSRTSAAKRSPMRAPASRRTSRRCAASARLTPPAADPSQRPDKGRSCSSSRDVLCADAPIGASVRVAPPS